MTEYHEGQVPPLAGRNLEQEIQRIVTQHSYNPRLDMSWESEDEGLAEFIADIMELVKKAERESYIKGRDTEIQILGSTDGCDCLTCHEVRYKLKEQLKRDSTKAAIHPTDSQKGGNHAE